MTANEPTAEVIREKALERIAMIFNQSVDAIRMEDEFGKDLNPSFVSDWKDNEFDEIEFDILYVANREILKKFKKGELVIITVGDYCKHMIRCHAFHPERVEVTLGIREQPSLIEQIKRFLRL